MRRALETLLAPFQARRPDEWRDAVNRDLRKLTGADGFFFRVSDGSPTRVDPLSPELLEARDAYRAGGFRAHDPWAVPRTAPGEVLVGGFGDIVGEEWFRNSEYYLDFLRPRGITDYVGAQIGTDRGIHVVLSRFNLGRTGGEREIARSTRLLRAVGPAFAAGMNVWLTVRPHFAEFGAMVDEVEDALLLCDDEGKTVHANSALVRLVRADREADRLRDALESIARDLSRARSGDVQTLHRNARERVVHTGGGSYRVRSVIGDGMLHGDRRGGVVLLVRPMRRGENP